MIYIFGWLTIYCGLLMSSLVKYRSKIFAYISLLVLGFTAMLRGSVGNDTVMVYEPMARLIQAGIVRWQVEPGFYLLMKTLVLLSDSPVIAVRMIALIFTILIFVFTARADRTEFYYSLTFIFPLFFIYSMNVIRLGLAFALLLIAFQYRRRNKTLAFVISAFLSLMLHYSMLIPLLMMWILDVRFLSYRNIIFLLIAIIFVVTIVYFGEEYFRSKLALYLESPSPSGISGLSKVFVNLVLMFGVIFSSLPSIKKMMLTIVILGLSTTFFILSQYSYAGLRFLDLVTFSAPMLIIRAYDLYDLRLDVTFKFTLLICGIIMAVGLYRNFQLDYGGIQSGSLSPFLPYHTIFQEGIWR